MFPIIETLEPLFFGSLCCLGSSSIRAYATDSKTPLLDEDDDFFSSDDGDNKFEVYLVIYLSYLILSQKSRYVESWIINTSLEFQFFHWIYGFSEI